jgi:hypothetical protein
MWQFERALLATQQDIQAAIADAKRELRRTRATETLERLRWARWQARLLGDAFAWIVLGLEDQTIVPLGENSRGSVPPRNSAGMLGVLAISEALANHGLGFPVLHDITDCLRIGDVTFVKPKGNRERDITTIEVKTRQTGQKRDPKTRKQIASLSITVHGVSSAEHFADVHARIPVAPSEEDSSPVLRADRRLEQQAARMARALSKQTFPDNQPGDLDGEPFLSLQLPIDSPTHWDALSYVTRIARRNGAAARAIDESFVLIAMYDPHDIVSAMQATDFDKVFAPEIRRVLPPDDKRDQHDAIVINPLLPPAESPHAYRSMPYFLSSIPKTTIFDLMHRRMAVVVLVNPGPIVRRLEAEGFEVISEPRRGMMPLFRVTCVVGDANDRYHLQMNSFDHELLDALQNFRWAAGVVAKLVAQREALRPLVGDIVAARRAAQRSNVTVAETPVI